MEEKVYLKNHLFAAFFVGLAIGLGSYYVWDNKDGREARKDAMEKTSESDEQTGMAQSKNTITVNDQFAGFTVSVDKLTLDTDGWVVIHEDIDGKPGAILGASRRDAGTYEKVEIELVRNTEEGSTYYAMLHTDDGDRQFDHTKDLAITAGEGQPVMTAFEATRR